MKSKISKFITIGVMLLLLALIVSRYPEMQAPNGVQHANKPTTMSKLTVSLPNHRLRAN